MIPTQDQVDWKDPEEHFVWCLRNMPIVAGIGAVTHIGILKGWSKHLVEVGAVHVDYLRTLADDDGNIHVDRLPKQEKKFQQAARGPYHIWNNAARWVTKDTPDPEPMRLQDVTQLTKQEQYVMAQQLRDAGIELPAKPPQRDTAQELNDG